MIPLDNHEYEKVVARTLRSMSGGPWTVDDLEAVRQAMDDDWCRTHAPACKSVEIRDWLDSLDDEQKEELLFRTGTDWNAEQDRWALS